MPVNTKIPIGVELVKKGIISQSDVEAAIEYQKEHPEKKLGDVINILNLCPQQELIKAMGEILHENVIVLNLDIIKIVVTDYLPLELCKSSKAIIFDVIGNKAKVCFADTSNAKSIEEVKLTLQSRNLIMEKYLTFETNILNVLEALEGQKKTTMATSGEVTNLVDTILKTAMEKRASDVHIEPMEESVRVRYRIDGELATVASVDKKKLMQMVGRLKAISNMHQEKQESQDGRILLYPDFNIRVSSQKTINGEKFCLRLLKKNSGVKNIFDLGFTADEKVLKNCFDKRNSITVIAAPTGEGKTTTLYSILDYLNRPEINITTVEDPVEIRVPGINQIEIDARASFASALRTILRQDPDIILLGEIRDLETAEIALQAGQTGHYVLSTIHTINAIEVVTRLRKMGISDYDISSTLATAVSQRLIRKICPECAVKRKFSQEEKDIITGFKSKFNDEVDWEGKFTYDIKGCKACSHTGFLGRLAAFEILNITDEIKEVISLGESSGKIRDIALKEGYRPLYIDAINKVINGTLTLEEVNKKLALF